jgi:YggT family protein
VSIVGTLIWVINLLASLLILLIVLNWVFSIFLDYYNPVRRFVDRIVEPMVMPIRRVVPLIGMFDISYLILILMVYAVQTALVRVLYIFL